jgi:hypothetical protein
MKNLYPEEVLTDLAWSFIGKPFLTLESFIDAVSQYQIDIDLTAAWHPDQVVIHAKQVKVMHDRWETDEEERLAEVILTADNGRSFTAGELLFKVHNSFVMQLDDLEHHFFEGFNLVEADTEAQLPCYEVHLGS